MPSADTANTESVRNHWWWRPGWRAGRHFYACHLTMEDQPQVRGLIQAYQEALSDLGNLDIIPQRWLHLTMQGIGFTDEIDPADLAEITKRITEQLRDLTPPTVTFHDPTIRPEAIIFEAKPAGRVYDLRLAVYQAIAAVLGAERFQEPSPEQDQYRPHVSAAYVNHDGPAQPIIEAVSRVNHSPVTATFHTVPILTFHRDHQMYEWTDARPIPIGHPAPQTTAPQTDL
jgi:2'-5' RNA ligase